MDYFLAAMTLGQSATSQCVISNRGKGNREVIQADDILAIMKTANKARGNKPFREDTYHNNRLVKQERS